MHKLFLRLALVSAAFIPAASALAADLDEEIVPPPPPPIEELRPATYDWTGVSAGVFVASNAVEGKFDASPLCGCGVDDVSMSGIGFATGLRVGADYQVGEVVFGAIADWSLGAEIARNDHGTVKSFLKTNHIGTLRGRVGWALDDTLLYATGGLAIAEMEFGGETATAKDSKSEWTNGFALGAGMEHALSDNFTVGFEYLYVKFGETDHFLSDGTPGGTGTAHMEYDDFHTVRASANYRFSL